MGIVTALMGESGAVPEDGDPEGGKTRESSRTGWENWGKSSG